MLCFSLVFLRILSFDFKILSGGVRLQGAGKAAIIKKKSLPEGVWRPYSAAACVIWRTGGETI